MGKERLAFLEAPKNVQMTSDLIQAILRAASCSLLCGRREARISRGGGEMFGFVRTDFNRAVLGDLHGFLFTVELITERGISKSMVIVTDPLTKEDVADFFFCHPGHGSELSNN